MLLSSQSEKQPGGGESTPNPVVVRNQLKRILAHPLFTNSKRYPVLLAYAVEQTLLGNAGDLKERTIGVEAFGREANYDVSLDPVVRTTAAEVRKRLTQYYYDPGHAGELIIELPVGSYVPYFREHATHHAAPIVKPVSVRDIETSPRRSVTSWAPPMEFERAPSGLVARHRISIAIGIALGIGAIVGFGVGRARFPVPASNLERFWEPITATSSRVTYCLGEPDLAIDFEPAATRANPRRGKLDASDVLTLARSLVPLVPRNGVFRVLGASNTAFTHLREGPSVLIGAFDNPWTMRITQNLPFGFEYDKDARVVVDRKSGQRKFWTLQWQVPYTKLARDYAIVARIHDSVAGQPVIVLAGILGEGTEAASEVASNPVYLDAMLRKAPKNWDQLNLEAVIETDVIEGHPGPPTIIAVSAW